MAVAKTNSWYLQNGTRYPEPATKSQKTGIRDTKLFPDEDPGNDRILNQMMFIPSNYDSILKSKKVKTILAYNGFVYWWKIKKGEDVFKTFNCPVNTCQLTKNRSERQTADLVLFHDRYIHTKRRRPPKQLYALYHSESPAKTRPIRHPDKINWTITYRHDSIITTPYNKWVYYNPRIKQMEQSKNFAAHKTKKVAWFVSNCWPFNNRNQYAAELNQYIPVDIYGNCGTMHCPLSDEEKCHHILDDDYKFYLAFENANCKNYITEKFFTTGLGHDVIPIVMGSTPEDYEKYAPLRSFIHVDHFKSPKELAEYLHILDQNDDLYNSYFKWKGTGEFIPNWAYFWCRICALLHDDHTMSTKHWYKDINEWWRGPGICTKGSWRQA
ncbi:glycoprotein 3-alpha-L-fucosyltransferase A-like isoform X2 [Sitodiplosis mosellana]|uniref:glycoprotein 3-alpha-L-fucosyltransferase A-like isoform X2 n=1 Tax=Sitodiplosis mosellana TaxID=263140 RepID=UPI0024446D78|nr:glycoprotein 3-alpha-L-fucosyltransferase A-like isoform X2 [Sitodiplosis mosellana]